MIHTHQSYSLPPYQDPEGCPVKVTFEPTSLQSFISISEGKFTFSPTQTFQLDDFSITVILTDHQGLSSNSSFLLTVYAPPKFAGSVAKQIDLMASN